MIPLRRGEEGEERGSSGDRHGERPKIQKSPPWLSQGGRGSDIYTRYLNKHAHLPSSASAKLWAKGCPAQLCSDGETTQTHTELPKNSWSQGNRLKTGVGQEGKSHWGDRIVLSAVTNCISCKATSLNTNINSPSIIPAIACLQRLSLIFTPETLQKRVFTFHNSTSGK